MIWDKGIAKGLLLISETNSNASINPLQTRVVFLGMTQVGSCVVVRKHDPLLLFKFIGFRCAFTNISNECRLVCVKKGNNFHCILQ